MKYVAIDCETYLDTMTFPDGTLVGRPPKPVCWGIDTGADPVLLRSTKKIGKLLTQLLEDPNTTLVGQNIPFDLSVAWRWLGVDIELIYKAHDEGRIKDTFVRELLIDTVSGMIQVYGSYALDQLLLRNFNIDKSHLKKGDDIWRLRYNELDGVKIKDYPEDAASYAIGDPVDTRKLFMHQEDRLERVRVAEEEFQTLSSWSSWLLGCQSPYVDSKRVKVFKKKHKKIVARLEKPLAEGGLLRWNPNRYKDFYPVGDPLRGGYSENRSVMQAMIRTDYERRGLDVPMTNPSKTFPDGQVKYDADTLMGCNSKALREYGRTAKDRKLVNAFVPMLEQNAGRRVMPMYNVLVSTGRMSCVKHDTPVLTREHGEISISEVVIGDHVWTHRGRWRPVTDTIVSEPQEMFEVTFTGGRKMTCTAEHRLLDSSNEWVMVGDYINEYLEGVGREEVESESSTQDIQGTVQQERSSQTEGGGSGTRDNRTQRDGSVPHHIHGSRTQDTTQSKSGSYQKRLSESHVGPEGEQSSSVDRGVRRWERIQNDSSERQTSIRTSTDHGRSAGTGCFTTAFRCTPHRREQTEQSVGQSSGGNKERTQAGGVPVSSRAEHRSSIEVADYAGLHKVYDITVAEDSSYWTLDHFAHNCRRPNMQQLPRAPGARECFIPPPGKVIACLDYDSFEMFGLAQVLYWLFEESYLLETLNENNDPHLIMVAKLLGENYKKVVRTYHSGDEYVGKLRQLAKIINFGAGGGMGAPTFLKNMDEEVRATVQSLDPDEDLIDILKAILNDWRDTWNMHPYFARTSKLTRRDKKFEIEQFFKGRVRGNLGYTDGNNQWFQGICADGFKNQMNQVMREIMVPGHYLNEHEVEYGGVMHDENMMMGWPDNLRKWTNVVKRIMIEKGREVMPDCELRADVQVTGDRWMKSGITVPEFEQLAPYSHDVESFILARKENKQLTVPQYLEAA